MQHVCQNREYSHLSASSLHQNANKTVINESQMFHSFSIQVRICDNERVFMLHVYMHHAHILYEAQHEEDSC